MNTLRIGVMVACTAAALAGYFLLTREAAEEMVPPKVTRIEAATPHVLGSGDERAALPRAAELPTEPLPESDSTDLLQPPASIDEILDAFNADLGVEGVPVDREELATVLLADPELAKAVLD